MKKIILFLFAVTLAVSSCKPNKTTEQKSRILSYAICEMDVQPGNKRTKDLDVVGDSLAVHTLTRYTSVINKGENPYNIEIIMGPHSDGYGYPGSRDTIKHTFSFYNESIVGWMVHTVDENDNVIGVDGSEYLGWFIQMENPVFCAIYRDYERTTYFDPLDPVSVDTSVRLPRIDGLCLLDTLGYIPSSLMKRNRDTLEEMLKERRYQDIFDFYKSNYHIYTCTGEEFRELVRLGLN